MTLSTTARPFAVLLDRRTRDIAVRAEYAAIPWLRLQPSTAASAVIKKLAGGMVSVASCWQLGQVIVDCKIIPRWFRFELVRPRSRPRLRWSVEFRLRHIRSVPDDPKRFTVKLRADFDEEGVS
jgi:hypothetical protein